MQANAVRLAAFLLTAALSSCATTKHSRTASEVDLVIDVASKNVRIGEQMFPTADDTALRAAISGACSQGCEAVEIRPTPNAPFVALHAVQVGAYQSDVERAQFRFADDTVVPLGHDPQTTEAESCPAQVIGLDDRMYVYVGGDVLPPTTGCDDWGATVCGTSGADVDERYDWEELRRRVRAHRAAFSERVCVNLGSNETAELFQRVVSVVDEAKPSDGVVLRTGKRGGELEPAAIETAIRARQVGLQTCFEDALTESKSAGPMSFTLRIVIGPDGEVDRAGIVDADGTTDGMEACVVELAKSLEFPSPSEGGNVVVNYPLSFSPAQ
jgi:hypothetical protein